MGDDAEDRWIELAMTVECIRCGNPVYEPEENAREAVRTVLELEPEIKTPEEMLDALVHYHLNDGDLCEWCQHILDKDC